MKITAKIWATATGVLLFAALAIKFYFLPAAERFSRLTVEEQIHRDMEDFEKIIAVVVTAANGDKDYVRRALYAISADKSIPIELRRSEFLHRQFGRRTDKEAKNEFEAAVLASGKAQFQTTEKFIEYAYPLKAQGICQGCHIDATGKPISLGAPVGLAIRRVPLSSVTNSRVAYFTLDLFWENFALVLVSVLLVLVAVWFWILRPVRALARESDAILKAADERGDAGGDLEMPGHAKDEDELHAIQKLIRYAKSKLA